MEGPGGLTHGQGPTRDPISSRVVLHVPPHVYLWLAGQKSSQVNGQYFDRPYTYIHNTPQEARSKNHSRAPSPLSVAFVPTINH